MYAMAAGPRRQAASCRLEDSVRHPVTTTRTLDGRKNVTVGGRGGYWFLKPEWLGATFDIDIGTALDVSVFSPAGDTTVIPISALFMVRSSFLKDDEFPRGRLQPYAGVGPGVFVSSVNGTLGPNSNVTDTSVDLGFDFRAGAAYRLTELFTLFAEYRFTHVRPEFSLPSDGGTATSSASFNTHHFLTGLGFRF